MPKFKVPRKLGISPLLKTNPDRIATKNNVTKEEFSKSGTKYSQLYDEPKSRASVNENNFMHTVFFDNMQMIPPLLKLGNGYEESYDPIDTNIAKKQERCKKNAQ